MEHTFPSGAILRLVRGDITKIPAGAIVNAANTGLRGGGGVDGAIHRAGGTSLMHELTRIREAKGGCSTGSAVVTGAGKLPADYVFHAVGPVYRGGQHDEAALLASCYAKCLQLADDHRVETITFPAISTGVYGYPLDEAARISLDVVIDHLKKPTTIREAIFVLFSQASLEAYERAMAASAL